MKKSTKRLFAALLAATSLLALTGLRRRQDRGSQD